MNPSVKCFAFASSPYRGAENRPYFHYVGLFLLYYLLKNFLPRDMIPSYRTNVLYRKEAEMTLEQLGEQYLRQADELHSLVSEYSAQLNKLDGIRLYEMNSKILTLREMERDTRIIGKQLTEYYSKQNPRKVYHSHIIN